MSFRIYADDHGTQKPQAFRASVEPDAARDEGKPGLFWLFVVMVWALWIPSLVGG